jgi:D-glycero-alpha-D-manno-heptose-7-phosphate kinase
VDALHHIKALALEAKDALLQNDLGRFGSALHDSWQFKKQLAPGVTNSLIDEAYEVAHRNGALGGKITGAGGGGFLLVFCPDEAQPRLREALQRCGLHEMQFGLEAEGARILMHTNGSQIEVPHE